MTLSPTSLTYMSHHERIMPRICVAKSFSNCSDKWVTRLLDCHLPMFGVNLLCWGTSVLLRNKVEHDRGKNWIRNSVFSFFDVLASDEEITFPYRFFSCFICFFLICFLICCYKSSGNVSDRTLCCAWGIV